MKTESMVQIKLQTFNIVFVYFFSYKKLRFFLPTTTSI